MNTPYAETRASGSAIAFSGALDVINGIATAVVVLMLVPLIVLGVTSIIAGSTLSGRVAGFLHQAHRFHHAR
jgi:hypothetical protein